MVEFWTGRCLVQFISKIRGINIMAYTLLKISLSFHLEFLFWFVIRSFIVQHFKAISPLETGRKFNVHKTFWRRPGRLLNVLCTFNLHPAFRGSFFIVNSIKCKRFALYPLITHQSSLKYDLLPVIIVIRNREIVWKHGPRLAEFWY